MQELEMINDNIFYVCSLIEFIGRKTKNHRGDIVSKLTDDQLMNELEDATVNHSLSFEQVSDEWIERYEITMGNYDTITNCSFKIPSYTSIGKVYSTLILSVDKENDSLIQSIRDVFSSFIIDEITYFESSVYYSNPSYLYWSYKEGKLLD